MSKMYIDSETLECLANALRSITGETRSYTPTEMIEAVTNIMETGTYIIVDKNGNEIPAVFVDNEQSFTATANDIRIGTTAVTEAGVTVGEKEIPAYYTSEGIQIIPAGSAVKITGIVDCAFTKLQVLVCAFNGNINGSVFTEKVSIDGKVYDAKSTEVLAEVTVDNTSKSIDLGVTNTGSTKYVVRYFSYKEEK